MYSPFFNDCIRVSDFWCLSILEYLHVHVSTKRRPCVARMCACVYEYIMHPRNVHSARRHQRIRWHILVRFWTPKVRYQIFGDSMPQKCHIGEKNKMNCKKIKRISKLGGICHNVNEYFLNDTQEWAATLGHALGRGVSASDACSSYGRNGIKHSARHLNDDFSRVGEQDGPIHHICFSE